MTPAGGSGRQSIIAVRQVQVARAAWQSVMPKSGYRFRKTSCSGNL